MISQELLGVFSTLANSLAGVAKPRARLLDHTGFDAKVEQLPSSTYTFTIHNVELNLPKRGGHLILHNFDPRLIADDFVSLLDLTRSANLQPDRSVEFQGVASGCCLRIAKNHTDFHAHLIKEDQNALALRDTTGNFAQRLTHQPRMQTHVA